MQCYLTRFCFLRFCRCEPWLHTHKENDFSLQIVWFAFWFPQLSFPLDSSQNCLRVGWCVLISTRTCGSTLSPTQPLRNAFEQHIRDAALFDLCDWSPVWKQGHWILLHNAHLCDDLRQPTNALGDAKAPNSQVKIGFLLGQMEQPVHAEYVVGVSECPGVRSTLGAFWLRWGSKGQHMVLQTTHYSGSFFCQGLWRIFKNYYFLPRVLRNFQDLIVFKQFCLKFTLSKSFKQTSLNLDGVLFRPLRQSTCWPFDPRLFPLDNRLSQKDPWILLTLGTSDLPTTHSSCVPRLQQNSAQNSAYLHTTMKIQVGSQCLLGWIGFLSETNCWSWTNIVGEQEPCTLAEQQNTAESKRHRKRATWRQNWKSEEI